MATEREKEKDRETTTETRDVETKRDGLVTKKVTAAKVVNVIVTVKENAKNDENNFRTGSCDLQG